MNIIRMALSELNPPERNVRIHSEKQLKEFERSVSMFGQIRPLVVDETDTILAGNGLYKTLLRMGMEEADVYKIEGLTQNQKKKLMIADNKVFNLGIDDLETFNAFLSELQGDLDIPGYDEEILRSMVAEAEEVTEYISDYGTLGTEEIQTIQANGERAEAQIQQNIDAKPVVPSEGSRPPVSGESGEEPAEVRKYATCPNCGEKVWL